jgi:Domain of unknown function (DUF4410)
MPRASCLIASATVITLALYGCAGTAPKPDFTHPIAAETRVGAADQTVVSVDAAEGVKILPRERDRIAQTIQQKIDVRKITNPGAGASRSFAVTLRLTQYEKGNAFARAMLAGVGQIHIDGTVQIYEMPDHNLVGEFQLSKTFAWGGIYGAATSIEDIEGTFADAVAATVTGQNEKPAKQAKN